MQTPNNNTPAPNIIGAIILFITGMSLSLGLNVFNIIGEPSLVFLLCIFLISSLFVAFRNEIEILNLSSLSIKMRVLNAIVANQTEPLLKPSNELSSQCALGLKVKAIGTDSKTDAVIKSLGSSSYTWRYLDSLVHDSGLSVDDVKEKLNWLLVNGFAAEFQGAGGKVYALTQEGRSTFSSLTA